MKPIIGIILRPNQNLEKQDVFTLYQPIGKAIYEAGGIPIGMVKPDKETEAYADGIQILDECDGLLLQGGGSYDWFDLLILECAYQRKKPILGICLGMQTMAIFKKGALTNVVGHHLENNKTHFITIKPNTRLFQILKQQTLQVNSRHYEQVIKTECKISAVDENGVIEAIELDDYPFFIGVEWHPEDMISYDNSMKELFRVFIDTCGGKK